MRDAKGRFCKADRPTINIPIADQLKIVYGIYAILPGSIVRLRSGGPDMTVGYVDGSVHVSWFSHGILRTAIVDKEALEVVR